MLRVLCDENIAHIDDYFTHHPIKLVKLAGRAINQSAIDTHQPDALLIRSVTTINPSTINHFGKIKFIGSATIGTDHVDINYLQQHKIHFANAVGCSKHSVAQYVISAILSLHPDYANTNVRLGIIGLGNIGRTLAKYAKDLHWQVAGYDPFLPASDINNSSLDDLLSQSDIISLHTPLTKTGNHPTYHLFDKQNFDKLKPNALFINSARGEIVCQNALINAINEQKLSAVLDVFPEEPYISLALLNKLALATPHIAGYTLEGKIRGTDMIYQAFCQVFSLPIVQHMDTLLPINPYHWQDLRQDFSQLPSYYQIYHDDQQLRQLSTKVGVDGWAFDQQRKHYPLKREWLYD